MTESHSAAPAAKPATTKLNPSAKSFVFSPSAPVWTPLSATSSVAAAPAPPTTPIKTSVLKPSAREFVPSAFAAPFVPSFAMAAPARPPPPPAAAPVASPQKPSPPVEDEPALTDASSSTSTHAEAEAEEAEAEQATAVVTTQTEVVEQTSAVVTTTSTTTVVKTVEVVETVRATELVETTETVVESSETTVETDALEKQSDAIGARIMYTIAQLLEMEPEATPMPPSVVGSQVMYVKGKDDAESAAPASSGKSGRGGKEGGGRGGGSTRGLNRSNSNFGEGGRGGRGGRGGGRGGRGGRGGPPADLIAMEDVVPLESNDETRWKPTHAKSKLDEPVDTTESSLKEAKSILNKLSIEKFDKLSDQLIEVAVRSLDVLSGVIDLVLAKAQMEWHFSTMYASLCSKIAQTAMPAMALDENEVAQDTHKLFRKLLLTRCQREFEVTPSREGWDDLAADEREEKELLLKRATLGHIRFVGELFKQRMLSSRIMHACVQRLFGDLTQPDEESLECLTKLLSTIGHKLETDAKDASENTLIAQYYSAIKQLAGESEKLSTRVRFMLQDLLELRKNKWVARRKETKAMTIAEVHAEAAREEKAKAKAAASASAGGSSSRSLTRSASSSSFSSPGKRRESKEGGGASAAWKARANSGSVLLTSSSSSGSLVDADGWETVSGGSRTKLLKTRSFVSNGPSSNSNSDRAPRHPSLARNASDHTPQRNSFSMLRSSDIPAPRSKDARERSFSSSAVPSRVRGSSDRDGPRPPRPGSSSTPTSPQKKSEDDSETVALSPDAFKKRVKGIFEEFVSLQDLDEAVACLRELKSESHHGLIIQQTMDIGLEKGAAQRSAVGALLAGLYEQKLLTREAFDASVREQLEFAEDMEIDIPLTLQYLAQILAPSVALGAVASETLVASVQHMKPSGKAAKFMALLCQALDDEPKAKALAAEVDMTALLRDGDDLPTLYAQYGLAFLL